MKKGALVYLVSFGTRGPGRGLHIFNLQLWSRSSVLRTFNFKDLEHFTGHPISKSLNSTQEVMGWLLALSQRFLSCWSPTDYSHTDECKKIRWNYIQLTNYIARKVRRTLCRYMMVTTNMLYIWRLGLHFLSLDCWSKYVAGICLTVCVL